jgi:hypothetical protein
METLPGQAQGALRFAYSMAAWMGLAQLVLHFRKK